MSDPTWTSAMLAANFESMRLLYLQAETERDAANTETEEQAWEVAKLRYYVESLERLLTPEQRQQAATEASAALALHNPPASVQPRE